MIQMMCEIMQRAMKQKTTYVDIINSFSVFVEVERLEATIEFQFIIPQLHYIVSISHYLCCRVTINGLPFTPKL